MVVVWTMYCVVVSTADKCATMLAVVVVEVVVKIFNNEDIFFFYGLSFEFWEREFN